MERLSAANISIASRSPINGACIASSEKIASSRKVRGDAVLPDHSPLDPDSDRTHGYPTANDLQPALVDPHVGLPANTYPSDGSGRHHVGDTDQWSCLDRRYPDWMRCLSGHQKCSLTRA